MVLDNGLTTYYPFVRRLTGRDAVIANSSTTGRDYSVGSSVLAHGQASILFAVRSLGAICMVLVCDRQDLRAQGH